MCDDTKGYDMKDKIISFRNVDLIIFSLLALITEVVAGFIQTNNPGAYYQLSFVILFGIIAVLRWKVPGAIVVIIGSIPMIIFGENVLWKDILLNLLPSMMMIPAAMLISRKPTQAWICEELQALLMVFICFGALAIGKALALIILMENPLGGLVYFMSQLLSLIMTYIIILLIRKREGLLVDMDIYYEHLLEDKT